VRLSSYQLPGKLGSKFNILNSGLANTETRGFDKFFLVVFLVLVALLHGVRGKFTNDVSETAVGPIFTGYDQLTSEDGTHNGFQNAGGKFTLHTVQKPPKSVISRGKSKIKFFLLMTQGILKIATLHGHSAATDNLPRC
jgi:hypothetical protein